MSKKLWNNEDARKSAFQSISEAGQFLMSGNRKQAAVHAVGAASCLGILYHNSQCECEDDHPDEDVSIFGASGPGCCEMSSDEHDALLKLMEQFGEEPDQQRMAAFPGSQILLKLAIKAALKKLRPQIEEMLDNWFA